MTETLPHTKMPKLVVVAAFDADENGDMQAVFGPAEQARGFISSFRLRLVLDGSLQTELRLDLNETEHCVNLDHTVGMPAFEYVLPEQTNSLVRFAHHRLECEGHRGLLSEAQLSGSA